jgi:putative addiction module killer protein
MLEIRHYLDREGQNPFLDWLRDLRDPIAKVAIIRRLNRLEHGNFGDVKALHQGVSELRIDTGPGYRIYFAKSGKTVVLLLCAGIKRNQQHYIERATSYWLDWANRHN